MSLFHLRESQKKTKVCLIAFKQLLYGSKVGFWATSHNFQLGRVIIIAILMYINIYPIFSPITRY